MNGEPMHLRAPPTMMPMRVQRTSASSMEWVVRRKELRGCEGG